MNLQLVDQGGGVCGLRVGRAEGGGEGDAGRAGEGEGLGQGGGGRELGGGGGVLELDGEVEPGAGEAKVPRVQELRPRGLDYN